MNNMKVVIAPAISYIATGRDITLRLISSLEIKLEKRWNKIDEEGNIFELDGHDEDTLYVGPISEFDYGTYFCEVRVTGEDHFFRTESARVLRPEARPNGVQKSFNKYGISLSISTRNNRLPSTSSLSPGVSPRHPYFKGYANKQLKSTFTLTTERNVITPDQELPRVSVDSSDSSSSYCPREDNLSLSELPKIRPNRIFRRDSNLSSESDIFHENTQLTSTPLGCPETPDWSLGSSGYAIASPSLNDSNVSSPLPSPISQLRTTFYEMAALPIRSSLSRLSTRSEQIYRPQYNNEHDFRLAGYQQDSLKTPSFDVTPRKSHFRFSIRSTSDYNSNK
ncbi:hypothetical protein LOD99_14878 [Oopsacas minuta]|uniref:Ig-like domain-containing protein n=1 Tax=Oopsacas minuta TaxID=111878 RepID=A0AAV7KDL2_9METZ|nr:hypothetical protein LOD99_14878 [Oopsacas minuta]